MSPRHLSLAFRFVRGLIRPPLMVFTRRDWRGAEQLPSTGGFVVCVNHISHVDPFTLGHYLLDHGCPPRFLGKQAVFRLPVLGRLVSACGQIPVLRESDRAGQAFAVAVAAVEAGECVAIYPEATLTRDPELWPMVGKTGAARIALLTGCPVIPIAQWGAHRLLPPYSKRLRLLPRTVSQVWAGPPVDLSAHHGRELDTATLRAATETIMAAITGLLEEIRGERGPQHRWDPAEHDLPRIGNPRRRRN